MLGSDEMVIILLLLNVAELGLLLYIAYDSVVALGYAPQLELHIFDRFGSNVTGLVAHLEILPVRLVAANVLAWVLVILLHSQFSLMSDQMVGVNKQFVAGYEGIVVFFCKHVFEPIQNICGDISRDQDATLFEKRLCEEQGVMA